MQASNPVQRCKSGWVQEHEKHVTESRLSNAEVVLIGDSIVRHYEKYRNVLPKHFNCKRILTLVYLGTVPSMFFGELNSVLYQIEQD